MVRAALRAAIDLLGGAGGDMGAPEKGNEGSRPEEAALSARLRRLGERLKQQAAREPEKPAVTRTDASAFARGFRLSTELVAGVLVGAFLGWLLDRWLGISPWGLIVFLLLGFAAGVLNVMRSAGITGPPGPSKP